MICWPHFSASFWPSPRTMTSAGPPAVYGTMMWTGLFGQAWALPSVETAASAARTTANANLSMNRLPGRCSDVLIGMRAVSRRRGRRQPVDPAGEGLHELAEELARRLDGDRAV